MPAKKKQSKRTPKARQRSSRGPKPRINKSRARRALAPARVKMAPQSVAVTVGGTKPIFAGGNNRITVTHRELLTDISSDSTDWKMLDSYDLNPGDADTFPWLSTIAWSWESYKFNTLRFVYEPRCATTQAGAVQVFTDFDNLDSVPVDQKSASSFANFSESPPYVRNTHTVPVQQLWQSKPVKFITPSGGIPSGADPTNYNCGTFYIFSVGTGAAALGSLWVEYTVELITPNVGGGGSLAGSRTSTITLPGNFVQYTGGSGGSHTITSMPDWLGNLHLADYYRDLASAITVDTATGALTLPGPALYQLDLSAVSAAGGSYFSWTSIPSVSTILGTISTGLTMVDEIVPISYARAGGALQLALLAFGATFAVLGRTGTLRLMSGAVPWTWYSAGAYSAATTDLNKAVTFLMKINPATPLESQIPKAYRRLRNVEDGPPLKIEYVETSDRTEAKSSSRK